MLVSLIGMPAWPVFFIGERRPTLDFRKGMNPGWNSCCKPTVTPTRVGALDLQSGLELARALRQLKYAASGRVSRLTICWLVPKTPIGYRRCRIYWSACSGFESGLGWLPSQMDKNVLMKLYMRNQLSQC